MHERPTGSNIRQQEASDPQHSIWVAASAGTGKTKILTDRILRLLITGAKPSKILCLTFTNAAAAEMHNRLMSRLKNWASFSENDVRLELQNICGYSPTSSEIKKAKTLYYELLSATEKINIHTIHSFCQKILKRFPFEAKITPGFQVLDDTRLKEIITKIKSNLFLNPKTSEITEFFAANFHEITINDLFDEILQNRQKIQSCTPRDCFTTFVRSIEEEDILEEARRLRSRFQLAETAELLPPNPSLQSLFEKFLTREGSKRVRLLTKKLAEAYPELLDAFQNLQNMIYTFDQEQKTALMLEYSRLVFILAGSFIREYEEHKREGALLDYDDLIYLTSRLLTEASARDWILYKLDGGIDHLLVDEAQDTSKQQWEIITALIEEFYAGEGSNEYNRSIFVVGDEKQSIFSFQGANLDSFISMNSSLKQKLQSANKSFKVVNLEVSYRSYESILSSVYNVFARLKARNSGLFTADNHKIIPFKVAGAGKVEIWPLITAEKPAELFWPLPDAINVPAPSLTLAKKITNFIKKELSLDATLKASDFMILVRTRDNFTLELIKQLIEGGVTVAGIDRINLSENIAILDLISAARFILSPYDDLNLACLLKSPIIGLSEEQIYKLATNRLKETLWQHLLSQEDACFEQAREKLQTLQELSRITTLSDFFHILVDTLGIRQDLIEAGGMDSNDAINELLYVATNYEKSIDCSLQSFIYWFENNQIEIKRDIESSSGVRIMTAHGSKGLQSRVVILADTTSTPLMTDRLVWTDEKRFFSVMQSSSAPQIFKELKDMQYFKALEEHCRLLYVAMTRAEEHLVICGYSGSEKLPENCWYDIVSNANMHQESLGNTNISRVIPELADGQDKLHEHIQDQRTPHVYAQYCQIKTRRWNFELLQRESADGTNISVTSPLANKGYLEYGRSFHKILEDTIRAKDINLLSSHPLISHMPGESRIKILKSIEKLLETKGFMNLLNLTLKAEVNIGISQEYGAKIGRIDLMVEDQGKIIIIDYKSDSVPPKSPKEIPIGYLEQLAFYKRAIQDIYPDKEVSCQILWLETAEFMDCM